MICCKQHVRVRASEHVVVRDCCSGDTITSRLVGVRPAVVLPVEAVCAVGAIGPRPKQPPASAGVTFGSFYKGKLCYFFSGF